MKWYVRHEDGEVWGPMEKSEAEDMRDQMDDACMFDERIFSPQFVTTCAVEMVLGELRGWRDTIDSNLHSKTMLSNAIDTIILLSREKVVTGSIEGGVFNIGEVPAGVSIDIRDYDVEGVDEELLHVDETGSKYFEVG